MKTIKILSLFLISISFSCSESDESQEEQQQQQGNISIAFSDFGGFVMENMVATISNNYETTNKITINVKADAEGSSGKLTLTIVDNNDDIEAFTTGEEYTFSDNTAPIYVTASFVNINRDFTGSSGKLRITKYEENANGNSNTIKISGTFNVTGNFTTMLSTINDLILTCNDCGS